jgi:hypothetical protein
MDKVVDAVSSATSAAVGTTTTLISEATKTATNVVTSSIQLLNVKEIVSSTTRQYILVSLLKEQPTQSTKDYLLTNVSLAISQIIISPIERCRILLKNQHLIGKRYVGAFDSFFQELRSYGIKTIFRGALPLTCYHLFYFNLLDFRVKTLFKTLQDIDKKDNQALIALGKLLGYDFGLLTLSQPFESLAHRIVSSNTSTYSNLNLSLYNGFSANLLMLIVNYSIMLPGIYLLNLQKWDQLQQLLSLLAIVALAEGVSYPFDLIKGRFMIQGYNDVGVRYSTLAGSVKKIYQEEHINGFFKGGLMKAVNFGLRKGLFIGLSGYVAELV